MRWNTALSVVAGLALPLSAVAGQIGITVTVAGQQPTTTYQQVTNGQPITIVLDTLTAATDVHVFDVVSNDVEDSLGMITLRGDNTGNHVVRVVVATSSLASVEDAFDDPNTSLVFGLKNLGGFQVLPVTGEGANPMLRDRTAVNISVRGDITGPITAGRLFRVQASRNLVPGTGGTISGDLRATAPDGPWSSTFPTFDFKAIGQVWAGWQITGDIIADGAASFTLNTNTWGSVERIVVNRPAATGPTPAIAGNILCEKGQIFDIVSPGQIGTATAPIDVVAGVSVGRITVREANSTGDDDVLAEHIFANVNASFQNVPVTSSADGGESLSLIETAGDFRGDISAYNVFTFFTPAFERQQGDPGLKRAGIFVGGDFIGDITVAQNYIYHDIIARSFQGKITIGNQFKGALVAVGTAETAGTIDEVEIGFATSRPQQFNWLRPGFSAISNGNMAAPFEGAHREDWYTRPGNNSSTVDGVIRASQSIASLRIKSISNQLFGTWGSSFPKDAKARVEAIEIGSLYIENFDSGAVWSGLLDSSTATVTNDMSNDYAAIGAVTVLCMGPMADLWVKDCPLIDLKADLFGEIHLPSLASGETIRIAGALGDNTGALNKPLCQGSDGQTYGFVGCVIAEDSPRGVWEAVETNALSNPNSVAEYGRVILQEPSSLNGQIIIDATNTTGAHRAGRWTGDVLIGAGTPVTPGVPVILSTSPVRAQYTTATGSHPESALAPLYSIPSSVLSGTSTGSHGGAVGLVPFARYEADCFPPNFFTTTQPESAYVEEDAFAAGSASVEVAFYGPIYKDAPTADAVDVLRVSFVNPGTFSVIPTAWWDTAVPSPRVLAIKPDALGGSLIEGRYTLEYVLNSTSNRLECDVGLGLGGPPVLQTTRFDFAIGDNCGIEVCLTNPFCFIADFNQDGGVDGDDVIAFFAAWDAGVSSADVTFENGVDGDDVTAFYAWWDIGGCGS